MITINNRRRPPPSLLERYGAQLGRIAERRQAEAALMAAKQEAERAAERAHQSMIEAQAASRAKTEFLANMSHELRSPLNAVIGFSKVMMDQLFGPLGTQKYEAYVKDIYDSGNHLLTVINDILDLAKIEAGKAQLDAQLVDVAEVTKFCLSVIRERATRSNISLRLAIPPDLPDLLADEQKLKQMLINLLSNAVKFTNDGGEVGLTLEIDADRRFVFVVTDSGIGITREAVAKIFEPFFQADSSSTRAFGGTGLGLTLAKAYVEAHGGRIWVDTTPGQGSTFVASFPASPAAEPPS